MTKYLLLAILILGVMLALTVQHSLNLKLENARISNNLEQSMSETSVRTAQNGRLLTQVKDLTITLDEMGEMWQKDQETIKSIGIKLKRLESIHSTGQVTTIEKLVPVRDTLYMGDTCKVFGFQDSYASIKGTICDSLNISIQTKDTLEIIAHRVPRKFLFFRFGTKEIRTEILNKSPYNKITFSQKLRIVE